MFKKLILGSVVIAGIVIGVVYINRQPVTAPTMAAAEQVKISLGYFPNVQFAPFYWAMAKDLFNDAGLEVSLDHGIVTEILPLLGAGKTDFALVDTDQVILARSQGIPVRAVLAYYPKTTVGIMAKKEKKMMVAADLKGKTIGIPGLYGSSYTALLAYLQQNGLTDKDIDLQAIGYTQMEAVLADRVDGAVIFTNNEPILLQNQGQDVTYLAFGNAINYGGNVLVTSEAMLKDSPEVVAAVVQAIARAMAAVQVEEEEAFSNSVLFMKDLSSDHFPEQQQVLHATAALFGAGDGLGRIDALTMQSTYDWLQTLGLLGTEFNLTESYDNAYLP